MSDDPFYQREKEKYENPVASREYLLELLTDAKKPLSFLEFCHLLNAEDEDSRIGIQRRLRAMEREGQIEFNRDKKYAKLKLEELIQGRVIGHRDGFGFLKRDDGEKDLFIHNAQMSTVLHGDVVLVKESGTDNRGRREARIAKIIEPRSEPIVGRYFFENGVGMVIPDDSRINHEITIPGEYVNGARQGFIVVVEIVQRPRRRVNAIGKVLEVLGEHMAPGMEIDMALRTFDIPHVWPKGVTKQIADLSEQVPEEAKENRIDLRQLPLVTIDGADARDFDDAVFCSPLDDGGWQLWVAIADVSYYVRPGTALDSEAQNRGNSVYFPEQVIPMLPEVLSNGLCSLNPQVDRLCLVCEMTISSNGDLIEHQFYEAVMNSKARLTYTKVWDLLKDEDAQGNPELHKRYAEQVPHLKNLHDMYRTLKRKRSQRGAIEFETQESKFVFNAQRKIDTIVPVTRNDAHKLIEECMILANVAAAKTLSKQKAEALYRIHDEPDSDRLSAFLSYLGEVGITHHISKDASPQEFTEVINKIQGRADQELIQTMLLRSMKQAVYSHENIGHFGLALDAYAHFTSPIRRYPDLVVHRALKATIDKNQQRKSKTGGKAYTAEEVDSLGEQCSMTERRADDATRDVADWLKCEFMLDHVGDSFEGVIASVTSFGFFVRLTEFHIDGLVHISALDNDFYHFDETKQHLAGENSGIVYRLGDPLEVKVAAVNLDERKIDFVLANAPPKGRGSKRGTKKSSSAKKGAPSKGSPVSKAGAESANTKGADKASPSKKKPRTRRSKAKGATESKPTTKSRRSPASKGNK
ncbi:ribonuclease R [Paraglaciecola polaris]|uniref:Ribonuclease R n=1 Tax=Paraglaciecola polaris LMG 21857 TaxID=1129793 RepID=K6YIH7_9ALTE|nr:ribonuclease R [Paraglaciecola polaris]GAC32534.1 ribonuclease R [Paraglaciecola polaris LMG 21857]|tara:strand:- start:5863 stop:8292 length:2430 start_codon:yes stop_codon:yes gene_type:complete